MASLSQGSGGRRRGPWRGVLLPVLLLGASAVQGWDGGSSSGSPYYGDNDASGGGYYGRGDAATGGGYQAGGTPSGGGYYGQGGAGGGYYGNGGSASYGAPPQRAPIYRNDDPADGSAPDRRRPEPDNPWLPRSASGPSDNPWSGGTQVQRRPWGEVPAEQPSARYPDNGNHSQDGRSRWSGETYPESRGERRSDRTDERGGRDSRGRQGSGSDYAYRDDAPPPLPDDSGTGLYPSYGGYGYPGGYGAPGGYGYPGYGGYGGYTSPYSWSPGIGSGNWPLGAWPGGW